MRKFSPISSLFSFKWEASPNVHYITLWAYRHTLKLTHSTYGWLLCWINGFQKEYYILYYTAWSSCGIRLYCILLSALFNRNFIDFLFSYNSLLQFFIIIFIYYFYRRECMWVMYTHLSNCSIEKSEKRKIKNE